MKDMAQFGLLIKRLRKMNNFTLRELGERSGISYSFIHSIENNRFHPSRETVIALADALDASNKDELLLLAGFAPVEELSSQADAASDSLEADDPEVNLFFKDFKSAPKERREEMLRFWNYIKDQQQYRRADTEQT